MLKIEILNWAKYKLCVVHLYRKESYVLEYVSLKKKKDIHRQTAES